MSSSLHAYSEYTSLQLLKSAKDSEYEIIFNVTRKLKGADACKHSKFGDYVTAIQDNRKLWSILSADICSQENMYPADLKARIFYLGEFVQNYSSKVLREDLSIEPLLEVNLAILRGLTGKEGME